MMMMSGVRIKKHAVSVFHPLSSLLLHIFFEEVKKHVKNGKDFCFREKSMLIRKMEHHLCFSHLEQKIYMCMWRHR